MNLTLKSGSDVGTSDTLASLVEVATVNPEMTWKYLVHIHANRFGRALWSLTPKGEGAAKKWGPWPATPV